MSQGQEQRGRSSRTHAAGGRSAAAAANASRKPEGGSPPEGSREVPNLERRRNLKIIGREPLATAIDVAVSRALRVHLAHLNARENGAIRDTARREFLTLLQQSGRRVKGISKSAFLTELERSRNRILIARDKARAELQDLNEKSEIYRDVERLDRSLLEGRAPGLRAMVAAELSEGLAGLFERHAAGELSSEELQAEILALTSGTADREWQTAMDERAKASRDRVDVLERRISKLVGSLEDSERALSELAKTKDVDPGLPSIYKTVQGLSVADGQRKVKESLLIKIFEANLALRGKVVGA